LTENPGDRDNRLCSVLAWPVTERKQGVCWSIQGSGNSYRIAKWLQ